MKRSAIGLLGALALASCACQTEEQLRGIASRAKIQQECRYVGRTPQISQLSGKGNLAKVVDAMGGGNVMVQAGQTTYQGLAAFGNTWWGDLYDCDEPTKYDGSGITVLSSTSAHPVNTQLRAAAERVRVTSNPEIVRGCAFLVNVNDLTGGEMTKGPYPVRQASLKYNTVQAGGDTVFLSTDPHTGEAYRCGTGPGPGDTAPRVSNEEAARYYTGAVREMHDEGLLKSLDELKHLATVNGQLWMELGPERRKKYALELANYCVNAAGGVVSVSIFDETARQVGGVGPAKP